MSNYKYTAGKTLRDRVDSDFSTGAYKTKKRTGGGDSLDDFIRRTELSFAAQDLSSRLSGLSDVEKAYKGWQTADTMEKYKAAVLSSIPTVYNYRQRLADAADITDPDAYSKLISQADELLGSFDGTSADISELTHIYGLYNNAEEYGAEVRRSGYVDKYKDYTPERLLAYAEYGKNLNLDDEEIQWLNDRISELKKEWTVEDEYRGYKENADFAEKSKYVTTRKNLSDAEIEALGYRMTPSGEWQMNSPGQVLVWTGDGDNTYEYINDPSAREKIKNRSISTLTDGNLPASIFEATDEDYFAGYDKLTEEEKSIYNYLYAEQGTNAASVYLQKLSPRLQRRTLEDVASRSTQFARDGGPLASILSIGSNIASGAMWIPKMAAAQLGKADEYALLDLPTVITQSIRTERGKAHSDTFGKPGEIVYNCIMSVADNLAAIGLVSAAGGGAAAAAASKVATSAILSSQAGSAVLYEARERGLDGTESVLLSVGAAIVEIVTEKFSLDALFSSGTTTALKYVLRNFLTEGSEEVASDIANTGLDVLVSYIYGHKNKLQEEYDNYLSMNPEETPETATKKVLWNYCSDLGESFVTGALSGGIMSGGSVIASAIGNYKTGASMISNDANIYGDGGVVSDAQRLAEEYSNSDIAKTAKKVSEFEGKKDSIRKSYNIGKLARNSSSSALETLTATERTDLKNAIMGRIISLGVDTESATVLSDAVIKDLRGEHLTSAEKNILSSSPAAVQAGKEIISGITGRKGSPTRIKVENRTTGNVDVSSQKRTPDEKTGNVDVNSQNRTYDKKTGNVDVNSQNRTYDKKTGKDVHINGVSFDGDNMNVKTESGATDVGNISVSNKNTAINLSYAGGMSSNPDGANLYVKSYNSSQDPDLYDLEWRAYEGFGRAGYKYEDIDAEILNAESVLDEAQKKAAVVSGNLIRASKTADANGRIERVIKEMEASGEKRKPGRFDTSAIRTDTWENMSEEMHAVVDLTKVVSALSGANIEYFDSTREQRDADEDNGYYDRSNNTIYIDINAGIQETKGVLESSIFCTLSHELVHWFSVNAPTEYENLRSLVVDMLRDADPDFNLQNEVEKIRQHEFEKNGKKPSKDDSVEEIVARSCEDMLSKSESLKNFVYRLNEKGSETARKFRDILHDIIDNILKWIDKILSKYRSNSKFAVLLREHRSKYEDLVTQYDKTFVAASKGSQVFDDVKAANKTESINEKGSIGKNSDNVQSASKNKGGQTIADTDDSGWIIRKDGIMHQSRSDGVPSEMTEIENKYKNDMEYLSMSGKGEIISVSNIVVKEEMRNKGIEQSFISDIIAYADKNGKTITLTPTSEYGTRKRLTEWCKKNGFIMKEAKTVDLRIGDTMYRLPNSKPFSVQNRSDDRGNSIRYAAREGADSYAKSSRNILADALMSAATNQVEIDLLHRYKNGIDVIAKKTEESAELGRRIHEITFSKNSDERAELENLKRRRALLEQEINKRDEQLLNLESMDAIKKIVERERASSSKKAREEASARVKKTRISQRNAILRGSIMKKHNRFTTMLLTNSAKKHVPDSLKRPLMEFLEAIDPSSRRKLSGGAETKADTSFYEKMSRLRDALKAYSDKNEQVSAGADVDTSPAAAGSILDLPENFAEELLKISNAMDDAFKKYDLDSSDSVLAYMTTEQLQSLNRVMATLSRGVDQMNDTLANATYAHIDEMISDTETDLESLGEGDASSIGAFKGIRKALRWDNTTPYYAMKRFGRGGSAVMDEFKAGQNKYTLNINKTIEFVNGEHGFSAEQVKEWSEDIRTVTTSRGVTFNVPVANIMSLFSLSLREQGLGHILGGGVKIEDYRQGIRVIKQTDNYLLSIDDAMKMISMLSEEQKKIAESIQWYMSVVCASQGNEISQRRWGIDMFTEKKYFPITTDANNRSAVSEQKKAPGLYSLLNMSSMKPLTPDANNALVLRNIFDVFTDHVSDMARYNAYALPLLDALKWYNTVDRESIGTDGQLKETSVQKAIGKAYGNDAKSYIVQLLKDINGTSETANETSIGIDAISSYKVSRVAANIRVALLQPLSYIRAANIIDPKYLISALNIFAEDNGSIQNNIKLMQSKTTMGAWKKLGFYGIDVSKSLSDLIKKGGKIEAIKDGAMKPAEIGDNITWGILYRAVCIEAKIKYKLTAGTSEYDNHINKRFNDVIYATQVVDSTLTRSQNMRSKSRFTQALTSFMSEPTLSYNIVLDQYFNISADVRRNMSAGIGRKLAYQSALKKNGAAIARTAVIYTLSAVAQAVVESLVDAARGNDDEDDEFFDLFAEELKWNLLQELSVMNKIPYFKDVWSTIVTALFNGYSYSSSRMDLSAASELVSFVKTLMNNIILGKGGKSLYGIAYDLIRTVSTMTGLPISNAMRDIVAFWNNTIGEIDGSLKISTKK